MRAARPTQLYIISVLQCGIPLDSPTSQAHAEASTSLPEATAEGSDGIEPMHVEAIDRAREMNSACAFWSKGSETRVGVARLPLSDESVQPVVADRHAPPFGRAGLRLLEESDGNLRRLLARTKITIDGKTRRDFVLHIQHQEAGGEPALRHRVALIDRPHGLRC